MISQIRLPNTFDNNQPPYYQQAMNLHTISVEVIKEAIAIKEQIVALEHKLEKLTAGEIASVKTFIKKERKKMSPAGRAKIGAAAKARWAKVKTTVKADADVVVASVKKAKRKLSPEYNS